MGKRQKAELEEKPKKLRAEKSGLNSSPGTPLAPLVRTRACLHGHQKALNGVARPATVSH
jgi:hypothetical protein